MIIRHAVVGGAAAGWPHAARAQQTEALQCLLMTQSGHHT
jgi:hypothetical protein